MMQTTMRTRVSRRHSIAGATVVQAGMTAMRRNSMNNEDSLARTSPRSLTFNEPIMMKNEKNYMKLNRRAILMFKKEQFASAAELFDEASMECLRTLPMDALRAISRRSSSRSIMPMPCSIGRKIRCTETKFYEKTVCLHDEYCPAMSASILLFNAAQAKRRANDYKGAFEYYQRAFLVYPKETSRVLVPILFNSSLILQSLVGSADVPILLCNFFGEDAKRWFCSPSSFLPERKVKDGVSTTESSSSSSTGGSDIPTPTALIFRRRASSDTTSNVPAKRKTARRVTLSNVFNINATNLNVDLP